MSKLYTSSKPQNVGPLYYLKSWEAKAQVLSTTIFNVSVLNSGLLGLTLADNQLVNTIEENIGAVRKLTKDTPENVFTMQVCL